MVTLDLSESEERQFEHALSGYGAVVCGGTPEERLSELRKYVDDPVVVVDGREIASNDDFSKSIALEVLDVSEVELEVLDVSELELEGRRIDIRRVLGDEWNLIVSEFDSMDEETQTTVAQRLKGLCESSNFDCLVGYTAEEGDSVVRAEPDLSMRVLSRRLK